MSVDINDICIISYQICYIINRYHSFCYLLAEIEELGDPDQPLKLVRVERRCVEEVIFDHGGHPHLQQNYTGHETTPCWNIFFWSFLSKTKRV